MSYVGNQTVSISKLTGHKRNYRTHEAQLDGLMQSLERRGQYRSIVAHRNPDGNITILAGHGVVQAAKKQGLKEIRVDLHEGLTEEQQLEILVADNELSRHAADDRLALSELLTELQNADVPLVSTGYEDGELDRLLNELSEPYFEPASFDEQGRLDEKTKVECPNCGNRFAP